MVFKDLHIGQILIKIKILLLIQMTGNIEKFGPEVGPIIIGLI